LFTGEQFASYGHMQRAFEAYYRLQEVEAKALQREDAEECVRLAMEDCRTSTPFPEYPHSRLMLVEAVAHLIQRVPGFANVQGTHSQKSSIL
jgi:hypothetical protein